MLSRASVFAQNEACVDDKERYTLRKFLGGSEKSRFVSRM